MRPAAAPHPLLIAWRGLAILVLAAGLALLVIQHPLPPGSPAALVFLALFIGLLQLFPLVFINSEWSLAHTAVLGAALLYGPGGAALAGAAGVTLAAAANQALAGRAGLGTVHLPRRNLVGFAYEAARSLLPLIIAVWLTNWQPGSGIIPALDPGAALRFTIVYSLLHAMLLAPEYLLGLRPPLKTPAADFSVLALLEWLPLPFAVAAALAYPALGLASLALLAGIPAALTILLNESAATRTDLERRLQDLTALNRISELMRYSLDLDSLLHAIQHQITELLGADNFYVALYDEPRQSLRYPLAVKRGEAVIWPARPLADRLTDRVIREREPILLGREAYKQMSKLGVPVGEELIFAWVGVPLATPDRTLGCLAVYSYEPDVAFTPADLSLLTTLSAQVSMALVNALLHDETENRARQLEALNITSHTISASLNLDEVFSQITRSVSQVSRGQYSAIYLLAENDQRLELMHAHGLTEEFQRLHNQLRRDDGLAKCLETGQPTLRRELAEENPLTYHRDLLAEGVRAYADLPLTTPEGQLGFLSVFYDQPQDFPPDEIELLTTFASQAALAVANARLYTHTDQALSRRAEQLRMLEIIGRQNSAALRSDELFELLLEYALDFTHSPWGALVLYNPARDRFELKARRGYQTDEPFISGPRGIAGRVAQTLQGEIVNDVTRDPDYVDVTSGETASQLTVPIIHDQRLLGIIALESPVPDEYTQSELAFVTQLADQAALAVLNAELYDQAQRRLHEQAALNMVSTRLASSQELSRVLEAVVQSISATLESHLTGIYLWQPEQAAFIHQGQMQRSANSGGGLPAQIAPVHLALPVGQRIQTSGLIIGKAQPELMAQLGLCPDCQGLVFPLNIGDQSMGLVLAHAPVHIRYAPEDLHLPRLIATQGALAVQNALLFSDASQGRDRLEAVLNAVGESVLMVTADGRISLANHPATLLTDLNLNQLDGAALPELPPAALAALGFGPAPLDDLRQGNARHRYENRAGFLERTLAPVWGDAGENLGWVLVIRDVTEEHQTNQARELITETLVHDLRSPIGTVQTTLDLLRESLPAEDGDPFVQQSLDIAGRSLTRVLTLVHSLLDISRLEAGNMDLRLEATPLGPLAQETISELLAQAAEHQIRLTSALPDLPDLRMDATLIRRVLTNLLDNALKFTPDGGNILVSAEHATGTPFLTVAVQDDGPGVPPEYRQEIFKRFSQAPATPGRRRGTGLGLTFCRLAVEAHGGRIWIEANPAGSGSVFKFTLPLAQPLN